MKVTVKELHAAIEVKNKGIEFGVHSPDGKNFYGDLVLTKTGLTWRKGKTTPSNGVKVTWEKFIEYMEGR